MTEFSHNYFVCVVEVATKLDQATRIVQQLSLTAREHFNIVFIKVKDSQFIGLDKYVS